MEPTHSSPVVGSLSLVYHFSISKPTGRVPELSRVAYTLSFCDYLLKNKVAQRLTRKIEVTVFCVCVCLYMCDYRIL